MELIKYSETGIVHVSNTLRTQHVVPRSGIYLTMSRLSGIFGVCHVVKLGQDWQNNAIRQEQHALSLSKKV